MAKQPNPNQPTPQGVPVPPVNPAASNLPFEQIPANVPVTNIVQNSGKKLISEAFEGTTVTQVGPDGKKYERKVKATPGQWRRYYGIKVPCIRYLIPRTRKVLTPEGYERPQMSNYTVTLADYSGVHPSAMQYLAPRGRIIWDDSDNRYNVKGNPFFYPIDLEHVTIQGQNAQDELEEGLMTDEMIRARFIHIDAAPSIDGKGKDKMWHSIGIDTPSDGIKNFWQTRLDTVVFEEVDPGSPQSYDPEDPVVLDILSKMNVKKARILPLSDAAIRQLNAEAAATRG